MKFNKLLLVISTLFMVGPAIGNSNYVIAEGENKTHLQVKNLVDGFVRDAIFTIDNKQIQPVSYKESSETYEFNFASSDVGKKLFVNKEGYEETSVTITNKKHLGIVSLGKEGIDIGGTRYSSSPLYNAFVLSSTRGLDSISFKFESPYSRFVGSNSEINFYINTGSTSNMLEEGDYLFKLTPSDFFIYDYSYFCYDVDKLIFNYQVYTKDGHDFITIDIPYYYLEIEADDVVGVAYYENLKDANIKCDFIFDGQIVNYLKTTEYVRINSKNKPFVSKINVDDPYWMGKKEKEVLTEGKLYHFADPKRTLNQDADDVYFSLDYTVDGLHFDFLGFGDFEYYEYFKIILHSDATDNDAAAWRIFEDDTVLVISSGKTKIYNNMTDFFDLERKNPLPALTIPNKTYEDHNTHFTLSVDIPLKHINCLNSAYSPLFIMATELAEGGILYEAKDVGENMFYNGSACGDPAYTINYHKVSAPLKRVCKLSAEEQKEMVKDYPVSFADPLDTRFADADDFHMNVSRGEDGFILDMIGFGDFDETELIVFTFHTNPSDGESWAIQKDDVTIMVSRHGARKVTGTTDYWVGTRWNRSNSYTEMAPIYERYESYFTLTVFVKYSEISLSFTKDSACSLMALEFGLVGVLYNSDPWTKAMRYNGEPCGDPAYQSYYLDI